jgi:hypothetical protein
MIEEHHAGLTKEEPTNEIVRQAPEFRELLDGVVPLERGLCPDVSALHPA